MGGSQQGTPELVTPETAGCPTGAQWRKNSCHLKLLASLPGSSTSCKMCDSNSRGRTQCWEISDRQPVASALHVFSDVLKGPEGDRHLCQLLITVLQPLQSNPRVWPWVWGQKECALMMQDRWNHCLGIARECCVRASCVHALNVPVLLKLQKTTLLSPQTQFLSREAVTNGNKICLLLSAFKISWVRAAPYRQSRTAVHDCDFWLEGCLPLTPALLKKGYVTLK